MINPSNILEILKMKVQSKFLPIKTPVQSFPNSANLYSYFHNNYLIKMSYLKDSNKRAFEEQLQKMHNVTLTNLTNYNRYTQEEVFLNCLPKLLSNDVSCTKTAKADSNTKRKIAQFQDTLTKKYRDSDNCLREAATTKFPLYTECIKIYTQFLNTKYQDIVQ